MRILRSLRRRLREERGYSLVELMTVMAILGVVMGGLTTVFVSASKAQLDMNQRFEAQQNARLSLARLRVDLHTGCSATISSSSLLITPVAAAIATLPSCAGAATVAWCVTTSPTDSTRYALYRVAAGNCTTPTSGLLMADDLATSANVFTIPAVTTGQRAQVTVDLRIDATKSRPSVSAVGRYELQDTIVLRNAPQAA